MKTDYYSRSKVLEERNMGVLLDMLSRPPCRLSLTREATLEEQQKGIDLFLRKANWKIVSADAKIRDREYEGDLLVERWSSRESGKPGWTWDPSHNPDLIIYMWLRPTPTIAVIRAKQLRELCVEYEHEIDMFYSLPPVKNHYRDTGLSYTTVCYAIPVEWLQEKLEKHYPGKEIMWVGANQNV